MCQKRATHWWAGDDALINQDKFDKFQDAALAVTRPRVPPPAPGPPPRGVGLPETNTPTPWMRVARWLRRRGSLPPHDHLCNGDFATCDCWERDAAEKQRAS